MPRFAVPETQVLSCAVATVGGAARVTVSGEIDLDTAPLLADALCRAGELAEGMILDLSGVEFIGTCGAELLLETARRVRARGDQFALDGASDVVIRLLCLIGVEDEFGCAGAETKATRPDLQIVGSPAFSR